MDDRRLGDSELAPASRVRVSASIPYDVIIGHDVMREAISLIPNTARRVLIVHAPPLVTAASSLRESLVEHGFESDLIQLPDAEAAKTIDVAVQCWSRLGASHYGRGDCVLTLGGGATTDLGGFVAATWLRGVSVVQVPTTLLAMIDAAVGGKVGINTFEGKNLVGSFHDPLGVVCDLELLDSLARHELVAGLGEVVKAGFIADPVILDLIEENPSAASDPQSAVFRELVERSITVKADVVAADPKESQLREILNYGHTFAHAIERAENYRWRHGAAVAVGMMFAAELANAAGILSSRVVQRQHHVLDLLGLPTSYRDDRWENLLDIMRRDKKIRADLLRFVVLEDVGRPTRLEGPEMALLEEAYRRISVPATGSKKEGAL